MNNGKYDGEEIVELYVSHNKKENMDVPIRALKGFKKVFLKKGEKKTIDFVLDRRDLSLVDRGGNLKFIPGTVSISIGGCQYEMPGVSKPLVKEIVIN